MSNTRIKYTAEYLYPGAFFPEETYRELPEGTFDAAVLFGPDEDGYFQKDGWYAVRIRTVQEKRFMSDDGDEQWVSSSETQKSYIVGKKVHYLDSSIADDKHDILQSNIKNNSRDGGYGVLTRCGNWQISSDWDVVVYLP